MTDQTHSEPAETDGEQRAQAERTPFEPQEQWLTYIERVEKPAGERHKG